MDERKNASAAETAENTENAEELLRLCDSEYRFMEIVWDSAPVESGQLVKLAAGRLGWKKSTTYTVLRKLGEKGVIRSENALVTVLVPKERIQRFESERVVERTFGGSLPMFIASFLGGKKISDEEAEEIISMIDRFRDEE